MEQLNVLYIAKASVCSGRARQTRLADMPKHQSIKAHKKQASHNGKKKAPLNEL
jgi:hypothetical protein